MKSKRSVLLHWLWSPSLTPHAILPYDTGPHSKTCVASCLGAPHVPSLACAITLRLNNTAT